MAKSNIWVEGCADSFGFKSIQPILNTPLIDIKEDITILTNVDSAARWTQNGIKSLATYSIQYESDLIDKYKLKSAQLIFWSCFAHYHHVKNILPEGVVKRAQSVVDYLTINGIKAERLVAKGYGESQLINGCNCDECTEKEHLSNRRTTFKIVK